MTPNAGTVLVVDDDPSVRRGLDRLLRSVGYRVETFGSARDLLKRGRFDHAGCLLLDVRMPGQTGIELHEVLRAAGHAIPIVFITGHGDLPMAIQAMTGAVNFLTKPFDEEAFLDAIRQAFARSESRRDAPG